MVLAMMSIKASGLSMRSIAVLSSIIGSGSSVSARPASWRKFKMRA
jgi:hypothetical protein